VYVNDAFGAAHRAHASTAGIRPFIKGPAVAGVLMAKELKYLYGAFSTELRRPFAAVIGGAKVSTKLAVLEALTQKCDKLLLGGGMVFTFYRALGLSTGASMVETDSIELAGKILQKAQAGGCEVVLPVDVTVAAAFEENASFQVVPHTAIPDKVLGLDIGPESLEQFRAALSDCNTILWNGPMGVFEWSNFAKGTKGVAEMLAHFTSKGAVTVVGGGDSISAANEFGFGDKLSHLSTGGGASLELLEGKELPGVEALDDAEQ